MLDYRHVDVFSREPLSGNGLTVFPRGEGLSAEAMQRITQEMRQFESIFLRPTDQPHTAEARIFTMEEELPFAGHPVLGAACVLHERAPEAGEHAEWTLRPPAGAVRVATTRRERWFEATMDQGRPTFGATVEGEAMRRMLAALNLSAGDQHAGLPLAVVSTGLPYLLVPLAAGLDRAHIAAPRFEELLASVGAKFVYVLDVARREGRTWDNIGRVEDVATGSAAGPAGAYLVRHGLARPGEAITLHQGRFVGRASRIGVRVEGSSDEITSVFVSGDVCMVARGSLDAPVGAAADGSST